MDKEELKFIAENHINIINKLNEIIKKIDNIEIKVDYVEDKIDEIKK